MLLPVELPVDCLSASAIARGRVGYLRSEGRRDWGSTTLLPALRSL